MTQVCVCVCVLGGGGIPCVFEIDAGLATLQNDAAGTSTRTMKA
jgi:hypothetical protein